MIERGNESRKPLDHGLTDQGTVRDLLQDTIADLIEPGFGPRQLRGQDGRKDTECQGAPDQQQEACPIIGKGAVQL